MTASGSGNDSGRGQTPVDSSDDPWQRARSQRAVDDCHYFAPCPRGLEAALASELAALGAREISVVASGIAFDGDRALGYRVNLHTRLASRVMLQITRARYRSDRDLHKIAVAVAWEKWFLPTQTLRVDTRGLRANVQNLNIATLRVKDGIVDRLREVSGRRPDIDTVSPQVRVFCFLDDRFATLYLDTSGENLFKRGWRGRQDKGVAPLKENLAAGLLALSGWSPGDNLVDPFCGSGTIVIEAAQRCAGIAAGALRGFGFENLLSHDAAAWLAIQRDSQADIDRAAVSPVQSRIHASDIDAAMTSLTVKNITRAGLADEAIRVTTSPFASLAAPDCRPGFVVSNPPYGERMDIASGDDREDGHARDRIARTAIPALPADPDSTERTDAELLALGRALRQNWSGWTVCLLSGDLKLPGRIGLKPSRRIPLYNGPIETRLFVFEMR